MSTITKDLEIYCPTLQRLQTVYFPITHYPDPFCYYFNGCDHQSGSEHCRECERRAKSLFRKKYPTLAEFLIPD